MHDKEATSFTHDKPVQSLNLVTTTAGDEVQLSPVGTQAKLTLATKGAYASVAATLLSRDSARALRDALSAWLD